VLGRDGKSGVWDLKLANRHGLIAGSTGTGKTVTLQVLAELLSSAGVPVFASDVKGDLSGIASPAGMFPVAFWDVFEVGGRPVKATVESLGPILLTRLLDLNPTQEGVLNIAFAVAVDMKLPIVNLTDLRAVLNHVVENAAALAARYGGVSTTSMGAIQRQLLVLENQGANSFFGTPRFDLNSLIHVGEDGKGRISLLVSDQLMKAPRLYGTCLLWLLSELFDKLPEVGDLDKPKLVMFFDEAHLLFEGAPKALMEKIEQAVRLIRSKAVGVYFVTQSPRDIPDRILSQLGNRVQHALRAFTPRDQKAVRVAAETFRAAPGLDTAAVITTLGKGEALVSGLLSGGEPAPVQRVSIRAPQARIGALSAAERASLNGATLAGQAAPQATGEAAVTAAALLAPRPQGGRVMAANPGDLLRAARAVTRRSTTIIVQHHGFEIGRQMRGNHENQ